MPNPSEIERTGPLSEIEWHEEDRKLEENAAQELGVDARCVIRLCWDFPGVLLSGNFTAAQLRRIADEVDRLERLWAKGATP